MRPFDGLKVIDMTHILAGPFCAYQLAVWGADVLKIEMPGGDHVRRRGQKKEWNCVNMGTNYLAQGSNKRSIVINIQDPKGRDLVLELIRSADVFIENFRAGALMKLGLGFDDLAALNSRLIYCSMTAFGRGGPKGQHTAYDHVVQAASGLMSVNGTNETTPLKVGPPVLDYASGTMAAFACATALFQRERTGRGCHIDMAMMDTAQLLMSNFITGFFATGKPETVKGNNHHMAASSCFPTRDGSLLMLGASTPAQCRDLMVALGRPDLADDYQAADDHGPRRQMMFEVIGRILLTRTAEEWEQHLNSAHVPAARVKGFAEAVSQPQLASRNTQHRHEHVPGLEAPATVPVAAFRLSSGDAMVTSPPPRLGEHTDEVLAGLGYTDIEVARLREAGVVA
ncbi:MAG: CoA transferase [Alphaproteobacteria bacterium]|nr:CoA transferase [Alphaproteobacteria bacterium]